MGSVDPTDELASNSPDAERNEKAAEDDGPPEPCYVIVRSHGGSRVEDEVGDDRQGQQPPACDY